VADDERREVPGAFIERSDKGIVVDIGMRGQERRPVIIEP
jgi:hypothetical protein